MCTLSVKLNVFVGTRYYDAFVTQGVLVAVIPVVAAFRGARSRHLDHLT